MEVKVDYLCYLPKEGHSPKVTIIDDEDKIYRVLFVDDDSGHLIFSGDCKGGQTIIGSRQWYTRWLILIYDSSETLVHIEKFGLEDKVVFIKSDAWALGDNIAWMPYIEEFRKEHHCKVICSTFFNSLFEEVYPDLLFVKPNTRIANVYAQYYIGANDEDNIKYSPSNSKRVPLQKVACDILGLPYREIKPKVVIKQRQDKNTPKYVCISEFASTPEKEWKYPGGWQLVVDYLNSLGYKVLAISKEPTQLNNVVNLTGDGYDLHQRITQLEGAKLFIGVSSGLSWLSWAVGTHVLMISDVTPEWHEFQTGITRLIEQPKKFVDYTPTEPTSCEKVLENLATLLG